MNSMPNRIFGDIPGYPPESIFKDRAELSRVGVHCPLRAGISGSAIEGADSIVLSGGYEDDEDHGNLIIYTGHGGRDISTGLQVRDQPFARGNRALAFSCQNKLPVRVIRGSTHISPFSPDYGYSYDGLYLVERYWHEIGKSGFKIWRFCLLEIPGNTTQIDLTSETVEESSAEYLAPTRKETVGSRLVRDSKVSKRIKALYKYCCQICGVSLKCPTGPYAEAAHIKPLGPPHNGPDIPENILCLCPNHHILFDSGAISVEDDLSLIGISGCLKVHRKHEIGRVFLAYHREHHLTGLSQI